MIGKTLAHYEITSKIGKGGMGEVYKAKDQKLGRDVAIKVLPEEFAKDSDRVARFQREAKLLASLNHPNIAAIHGLDESDGMHFLILELIEGDTLADRLKHGAIPIEESLKLALQIAEALEAAHEKGVIHRDLKPANIKVTPDGKIKVLDFGLAKAFAADQGEMILSDSPTLSVAATQKGVILGTAAYMSPEQARGEAVDKRADIWAFGCVLYEMLTGRVTFEGRSVSDVLASVLKIEPEWKGLPLNLHPRIRLLLERCLEKEVKDRCSAIGEARADIQKVLNDPGGVLVRPDATAGSGIKLQQVLPWIGATFILTAIVIGAAVWKLKPPDPGQVIRFDYELPDDQQFGDLEERALAVSPDGRQIIYKTTAGFYLRSLDKSDAEIIPRTDGNPQKPFFSPDGKWVGYVSENQIKKIAVSGGAPAVLAAAAPTGFINWRTNDIIEFGQLGTGILRVSANGGEPEIIVSEENEMLIAPQMLPDGKSFIFTDITSQPFKVMVQSLETEERKELLLGDTAQYLPTGHLVYAVENDLFAVPFDLDKLEVAGTPISMIQGVLREGGAPQYAVSDSGTLIYIPGTSVDVGRILVWVDRSGREETIEAPPRAYAYAHLSPDGTRVALDIRDQENDIWIWDLARKNLSRLSFDPGLNRGGIWTPDGEKIAFSADRDGDENIYWQTADGSGIEEPLTKIPEALFVPNAFSPDGRHLLFSTALPPYDIDLLSLNDNAEPKSLLETDFNEQNPQISLDGRWRAYQSDESGILQVYVRPFPDVDAGKWQISSDGGSRPLWNRNGRELFYYVEPGTIMAVPVETGTSFSAGTPEMVFKGEYISPQSGLQYSVTPDGQKFLMIKNATNVQDSSVQMRRKINIIVNWFEELKERVPVD
jgi:serine/threonine protein kinase